jgi:hypothetical protein
MQFRMRINKLLEWLFLQINISINKVVIIIMRFISGNGEIIEIKVSGKK